MFKKILNLTFILIFLTGLAYASDGQIKKVDQTQILPSFLGYAPGKLIVKFKETTGSINAQYSRTSGKIVTGIPSLDNIAEKYLIDDIRPQFAGAKPEIKNGKAIDLSRYYKVIFDPSADLDMVMQDYKNDPNVESVEKIGIHSMYATPNDGYYSPYQWHLNATGDHDIDAPEAWDLQTGSTSVIVAILDSGTRYYHPDLGGVNASVSNPSASRGNMWINTAELNGSSGVDDDGNGYTDDWIGYDFIDGVSNCWTGEDCITKDNDPRDFNGHGTHTSGIFGMLTNDGYGMAGVAGGWGSGSQAEYGNGVKIMACRMGYSYNYNNQEYGVVMMDAAAEAFYYAANNGAKIASCSWGSSNTGGIGAAVDYFINSGGIVCVAAGNDGSQTADYLNGRGDCISVAATDQNDAAASFTTYGTWVDISAPGVGIYSTYHDHTDPNTIYWAALDGTSMATPMVAGVVALIWSQNPAWTSSQVKTQLYSSADNIDAYLSSTYIGKMGAGRINAYNAVNTGPPPAPVAAFVGSPTSGTAPLNVNFTDQSTGSITSWSWTFGDGGTSTLQNPSHTYNSAGTYTVTLNVVGPGGSDGETKTGYITVSPCVAPVANFTGSPTSGDFNLLVSFTDLSTNSPSSWAWNFGDGGTSTAQNPTHTYTAAGTYTVALTATNSCGSDGETKTGYITVTEPTVDYATLPYSFGFETGSFDNYWFTQSSNSNGRILITSANTPRGSYHMTMDVVSNGTYAQNEAWLRLNLAGKVDVDLTFWWKEFSDEDHTQDGVFFSNNGGSSFVKVYNLTGGSTTYQQIALDVDALAAANGLTLNSTFVVKFQQYDNYVITTDGMAFDDISVISNEVPPTADFSGTPTVGDYPLSVQFTDASALATSWSWAFGDGGTSTAQNPSHTYTSAGYYTVALTAYNAYGNDVETKINYITVTDPSVGGWTTITYDDFESGWGSYTDGGGDCALYTYGTYSYQGNNSANIQDNSGTASSFYHTVGYNVSGYSDLEVEFYFVAISMDYNEDFWLQYYNGSSWVTVGAWTQGVHYSNNTFYHVVVSIPSGTYNYPTNARLRFVCDASNNTDDVYIDQIEFRGYAGGVAKAAEAGPMIPAQFSVAQNYPNPFNPATTIQFSLPITCNVTINIYNIAGQRVQTLTDQTYEAGTHSVVWNADVASGIYFYRVDAGEFTDTKKMVLLK